MALGLIIGGRSVAAKSTFDVLNPSSGEVVGQAPNATLDDLDAAVAAADSAFQDWSKLSDAELQDYCAKVTSKINDHSEELAILLTKEQGKPLNGMGSRFEMGGSGAWAGHTTSLQLSSRLIQDDNEGRVELFRRPLGVVGSITPWNWPVMIAVWHILPALRTGNTVVSKPSPYTPLSTLRMIELMNEVLPAGVVNCVPAADDGDNIGAAMSAHPGIRKLVFTGSCATGRKVMMSAAETMKRLTLELGGNDAGIILGDVNAGEIAEGLFWGAFVNNGQTCAAMKRAYVHEDVYDDVCAALADFAKNIPVGDGLDENSILGPVQNKMQFEKVARLVEDAKHKGTVLVGGEPGVGLFFDPTIIAGLNNGDALVDEEQFGPALPIIKFSDEAEAMAAANDSDNGLGGSIWTRDIEKARAMAADMECGSVWINSHGGIRPDAPFGGRKGSGIGVEFAEEGLTEYTDIQVVHG